MPCAALDEEFRTTEGRVHGALSGERGEWVVVGADDQGRLALNA